LVSLVTERFSVSLMIESDNRGGLDVTVRSVDAGIALSSKSATVLMTAWREADSVVRARLENAGTGLTSYLQGNESLFALGESIGLKVSCEPRLE
jgi:hypothetical protein